LPAYCIWRAPSKEVLEKVFEQAPTVKAGTDFVQVMQVIPPTMEYVASLVQTIIKMASK